MVLGSCVIVEGGHAKRLTPQAAFVHGSLHGLVAVFVIRQEFRHERRYPMDVDYLVADNLNLCMYDTTFYVGDEVIKPRIEEYQRAEGIFREAKKDSRTAIIGRDIGNGLVRFRLCNVPPDTLVVVEVKSCVFGHMCADDAFQFKIPLDVCTQSGSVGCIMKDIAGPLLFTFDYSSRKDDVWKVTTNVSGCVHDHTSCKAFFSTRSNDVSAIILTVKLFYRLSSECLAAGKYMALSVCGPSLEHALSETKNNEFVFVVDCSGSMSGSRIRAARECLQAFISSLPLGSYFNVVRFGSKVDPLFNRTMQYTEETYGRAKKLAAEMRANMGGTDIFSALKYVFSQPHFRSGQRQIFLLTDGEVANTDACVKLVMENMCDNRVFTLGIGDGADSGIIHGLADASGGESAYVMDEHIADTVIPQLEASMGGIGVMDGCVHIENHYRVENSRPLQIRSHSQNNCLFKSNKEFHGGEMVLINGGRDNVEICVTATKPRSEQRTSVSNALRALFSWELIQNMTKLYRSEKDASKRNELKAKVIELSKSSGVLSSFTSFVGFTTERAICDIFVRTLTGRRIVVPECATVLELKEKICQQDGSPINKQTLLFQGHPLENDRRLEDYGIHDTSEISTLVIMRGGGPGEIEIEDQEPVTKDKLTLAGLLSLQSIDGHWQDVSSVLSLLGKRLLVPQKIHELKLEVEAKNHVYHTCVAIAILQRYFGDRHKAWTLAKAKAMAWLSSLSKATKWEDIISEIMAHLSGVPRAAKYTPRGGILSQLPRLHPGLVRPITNEKNRI